MEKAQLFKTQLKTSLELTKGCIGCSFINVQSSLLNASDVCLKMDVVYRKVSPKPARSGCKERHSSVRLELL
jgi:hypothetical protein